MAARAYTNTAKEYASAIEAHAYSALKKDDGEEVYGSEPTYFRRLKTCVTIKQTGGRS